MIFNPTNHKMWRIRTYIKRIQPDLPPTALVDMLPVTYTLSEVIDDILDGLFKRQDCIKIKIEREK
jgi:hypothetical protein